jgi:hypothetical protein
MMKSVAAARQNTFLSTLLKRAWMSSDLLRSSFEAIRKKHRHFVQSAQNLLALWKKCNGDDIAPGMYGVLIFITNVDVILVSELVETTWLQYCSSLDHKTPSSAVAKFHSTIFHDIVNSVARFPCIPYSYRRVEIYELRNLYELLLLHVHMAKLFYCLFPERLVDFVQYEIRDPNTFGFDPEPHYLDSISESRAII